MSPKSEVPAVHAKQHKKASMTLVTNLQKWLRPERPNRSATPDEDPERGAVLMILGLLTTVLMISAAFAVDFGSWYSRAEKLQNAADAAALAGAHEYDLGTIPIQPTTANPTPAPRDKQLARGLAHARILDVLAQNGIVEGGDINIQVNFPGELGLEDGAMSVRVVDRNVNLYFSGMLIDNMTLQRQATAAVDRCGVTCTSTVPIPRPFQSVTATGSGDGYVPLIIDDFVYAVNHHSSGDFTCKPIDPAVPCVAEEIAWASGTNSDNNPLSQVVGERFFTAAQQSSRFVMLCFDTLIQAQCAGSPIVIDNLSEATSNDKTNSRGGGTAHVNGRLFVFTDDHKVHCIDVSDPTVNTFARCAGYSTPKASGLGAGFDNLPSMTTVGNSGAMSDSIILPHPTAPGEARIYVDSHFTDSTRGTRLHCWDTYTNAPCANFRPGGGWSVRVFASPDPAREGRLFFNRNTNLPSQPTDITGICAVGYNRHQCFDLNGANPGQIANFTSKVLGGQDGTMGRTLYHADSGRLFIPIGHRSSGNSANQCWDFTVNDWCGETSTWNKDYGYAAIGDCIVALGHDNRFWTFGIDMTADCGQGTASTVIFPCVCYNGDAHWGNVMVHGEFDPVTGPFKKFEVRVKAPDDTLLSTEDLLASDGLISLDTISPDYPFLKLDIVVEGKVGHDPWSGTQQPTVIVGYSDKPHLVD